MQLQRPLLYLGDTQLGGAAAYLAGILTHIGFAFDYVPSDQQPADQTLSKNHLVYVISDYPAKMLSGAAQDRILSAVAQGAGLLMIGGWESYHGDGGNWDRAPLAEALPVKIAASDDRINCDQPALIVLGGSAVHPATAGLPWNQRPPTVGGFNAVVARPGAQTLLEVERYRAQRNDRDTTFEVMDRHPLLVVGKYQRGRTAALMTDAAPHWVGGLVDWGEGRVKAQAPGAGAIEVGNFYAAFFTQLLAWLAASD